MTFVPTQGGATAAAKCHRRVLLPAGRTNPAAGGSAGLRAAGVGSALTLHCIAGPWKDRDPRAEAPRELTLRQGGTRSCGIGGTISAVAEAVGEDG